MLMIESPGMRVNGDFYHIRDNHSKVSLLAFPALVGHTDAKSIGVYRARYITRIQAI